MFLEVKVAGPTFSIDDALLRPALLPYPSCPEEIEAVDADAAAPDVEEEEVEEVDTTDLVTLPHST